ncbi:CPBP family intramembrane metalloprotease [Nocardioides panacisoli]|uniref:CPBP family intramembrane glutamic endopeptidase n=1 Tax=Nocardioides panacisoli TaxID=627624 RepID=UPI001C638278|nr:type II CAAX endopeptidase family protein [Nocardioides panacisoli]QYJ03954.1 CPBP family intramembrane metalloprotease [Nocardioides panacisoli]
MSTRATAGLRGWLTEVLGPGPEPPVPSAAALRRRRLVAIGCLLVGSGLLAALLRTETGSPWFYPLTLALAVLWTTGAFASGPLRLGRVAGTPERTGRRPVVSGLTFGVALVAVFTAGGLIVREIPWLERQVGSIAELALAARGPELVLLVAVTAINGVAEELFFRGALFAALGRDPIIWTTLAYTAATLATGNVMLGFAAAFLGVVTGLQRRASGGVLAPILTHCTWSLAMLFVLPLLFG